MEWEYVSGVEKEIDEIREKALAKAQAVNPDISVVVDNYTLDDYCYKQWDYPGKWYCYFCLPKSIRSKEDLIDKIAADTIARFNKR